MKYRYENVKCLKVIDGDTIRCRLDIGFYLTTEQSFRLYRINAPETRTRDKKEKKRGLAAKERLKELVEGKTIVLETHKAGKFGRWVTDVYIESIGIPICVNDQLVREKHAVYKDY